jgi:hypothetical protein
MAFRVLVAGDRDPVDYVRLREGRYSDVAPAPPELGIPPPIALPAHEVIMSRRILFLGVVAGLLAVGMGTADDPKPPVKAPAAYFKVEIRGTLQLKDQFEGITLDPEELVNQPVKSTIHGMPLALGEDKELAALAKKLGGKTVLVNGDLTRVAGQRIAVQPTHYVYYVKVTALKAAE